MRIAYVSSQFPPDSAIGGIATYTGQIARVMAARGHSVEVFAGSPFRDADEVQGDIRVNWVKATGPEDFPVLAAAAFANRHRTEPFDLIEGPEFQAEARVIADRFPGIPLVVKLHAPSLWLGEINGLLQPSWRDHIRRRAQHARMAVGAWRRGERAPPWTPFDNGWAALARLDSLECAHAHAASLVAGPSRAIIGLVQQRWKLQSERLRLVPNVYAPAPKLLAQSTDSATGAVGFFGRLEALKGIFDLAAAIPMVLRDHPAVRFRLAGSVPVLPGRPGTYADAAFREIAGPAMAAVTLLGQLQLDQLPAALAQVDVCVIPSHWENFPTVCLEAMAAGRAIVATNVGGIGEMLADNCGILVPPHRPEELARAISALLAAPAERAVLGTRARARVLAEYGPTALGPVVEHCYREAIAARRPLSLHHQTSP